VKQEHPELAREAAIVAAATISDPDKFQEAAQAGILREEMADLDPANVEPITGTV
jgi:hypothetical protein